MTRKVSKASVHYVDRGTKAAHCGICAHFQPPDACEGVMGIIDRRGWCRRFQRKAATKPAKED